MRKHRQATSLEVNFRKKRDEFSHTNTEGKFQMPEIKGSSMYHAYHDHITLKVAKLCHMDEKMRKDEEKIESVQKKVHGLSSHIIKTASEMDQHIDVIEKEYRDTQEEFKHQGNPKFPRIAKYERLSKKIEKWVEKVESLKDTIQTWLKKSKLLEEHTKRWNDDVKTWNETASNTGKQIDLLKLQVEFEEGIYRMIAQVAGGSWIEKVQNRIKTQQISFCNFKEKLETIKSPNWKHINCRDSHIATASKYFEKEFQ